MATVKFQGNIVNLQGDDLSVGDFAPVVEVIGKDLKPIKVGGSSEKIQILITVPSLDTDVCATETRKFNQNAANQDNAKLTVISMDLPFAMDRFCSTEGIKNLSVGSDFRNKDFANAYGVLIKDGLLAGLCTRAVFVVGKDGKILHKELVSDIATEPNYEAIKKTLTSQGCSCNCSCN